jgi:hypothetical protein
VHRSCLVPEHSAHAPSGWHAGSLGSLQSLSSAQGTHFFVAPHTGSLGSVHSASVVQSLPDVEHSPAATLHTSLAPQRVALVCEHSPHLLVAVHAGRLALVHSASVVQVVAAVHWCVAGSHTGVAVGQSVDELHWTHCFDVRSHTGVGAAHCVFDVHATQTPALTSQAGVAPLHVTQALPHNAAQD